MREVASLHGKAVHTAATSLKLTYSELKCQTTEMQHHSKATFPSLASTICPSHILNNIFNLSTQSACSCSKLSVTQKEMQSGGGEGLRCGEEGMRC